MSDHSDADIKKHVRTYILIFVALLVGTVITVGLNSVHFDSMAVTVTIALFVACVKAFLVAGFFMHLISEKKAIYAILLATVFFFAGMMYLTVWSYDELPRGSKWLGSTRAHSTSHSPAEQIHK